MRLFDPRLLRGKSKRMLNSSKRMENTPLLRKRQKLLSKDQFMFKRKNIPKSQLSTDVFHALMDLPFIVLLGLFVATFTFFSVVFGAVYMQYDKRLLKGALGVQDSYGKALFAAGNLILNAGISSEKAIPLQNFKVGLLTLALATAFSILLGVYMLGLLYQRISSGRARGRSILFSPFCVIEEDRLVFEVVEARRHQLIGSNIGVFAFDYENLRWTSFQVACDQLFPALPNRVHAMIPSDSPLWRGRKTGRVTDLVDSARDFEIVVVVEGNEPVTGAPVRAIHSYSGDSEIKAPVEFPNAVGVSDAGEAIVDLQHFKP
jgi:hypothetical protein